MSAIEAKPLAPDDISVSLGTTAQAEVPYERTRATAESKVAENADEQVIRLTKITLILPSGGLLAYMRAMGKRGGM